MINANRIFAGVAAFVISVSAWAQESAKKSTKTETRSSLVENVSLISREWWLGTLAATVVLGLVIGYFIYRNAVKQGRAAKATGCGCFASVVVFLLAQILVVVILVTTIFSASSESRRESRETKTETTAAGSKPKEPAPAKPGGESPAKPAGSGSTKPSSTGGDDF